jgi:hypothetical protein
MKNHKTILFGIWAGIAIIAIVFLALIVIKNNASLGKSTELFLIENQFIELDNLTLSENYQKTNLPSLNYPSEIVYTAHKENEKEENWKIYEPTIKTIKLTKGKIIISDGRIIEIIYDDGTRNKIEYELYGNLTDGNSIEIRNLSKDGREFTTYRFNKQGKLIEIEIIIYDKNGKVESMKSYGPASKEVQEYN